MIVIEELPASRRLDLTTLTDDQLGTLAAQPMDADHWAQLELEICRRIAAELTAEWTLA